MSKFFSLRLVELAIILIVIAAASFATYAYGWNNGFDLGKQDKAATAILKHNSLCLRHNGVQVEL